MPGYQNFANLFTRYALGEALGLGLGDGLCDGVGDGDVLLFTFVEVEFELPALPLVLLPLFVLPLLFTLPEFADWLLEFVMLLIMIVTTLPVFLFLQSMMCTEPAAVS